MSVLRLAWGTSLVYSWWLARCIKIDVKPLHARASAMKSFERVTV